MSNGFEPSLIPINGQDTGKPFAISGGKADGSFAVFLDLPTAGSFEIPAGHADEGRHLVAFSRICTHMGCHLFRSDTDHNVTFDSSVSPPSLNCGPCPCHGTMFDLMQAGLVILGPATQNLAQLQIAEMGGDGNKKIFAVGWQSSPEPSSNNPVWV